MAQKKKKKNPRHFDSCVFFHFFFPVQVDFALIWTNCATYCAHAVKQGNIDHETSVSLPEQAGSLFEYVKELVEDHQEKERYVKPVWWKPVWWWLHRANTCKHVLGYLWVPLGVECTRAVYLCPVDVLRCLEYNHEPILMSFCVQDGGTAADV